MNEALESIKQKILDGEKELTNSKAVYDLRNHFLIQKLDRLDS